MTNDANDANDANDERRTTNDERRTTNDERRTTNGKRQTTNKRVVDDAPDSISADKITVGTTLGPTDGLCHSDISVHSS